MGWLSKLFDPDGQGQPTAAPTATPSHINEAEATLDKLRGKLTTLVAEVNRSSGSLPAAGVVFSRRITDGLSAILEAATARSLDVYALMNVEAVMEDYLPSTLRTYVAAEQAGSGDQEKLVEQLKLLHSSVVDTLVALKRNDAQALEVQHRFIKTKFTGSDLD